MNLGNSRFTYSQYRAYLLHRELFLVIQRQHLLLPLRQPGDSRGQHSPPFALHAKREWVLIGRWTVGMTARAGAADIHT